MHSEDESSDSETVRKTLEYSATLIPPPIDLQVSPQHPAGLNDPTGTLTNDIDSSMHPPSPTTPSVASQPNTANQPASLALQRLHNYIDSQLTNLVGVAVEQAIGARYNQLADSINGEIASIKNQVLRDEDDPMQQKDQAHDGDDESEENNRNHRRDRRKRGQASNTKRKNNRHNRRQTSDYDGDDEEDENDNSANDGGRRKGPIVLTVHN